MTRYAASERTGLADELLGVNPSAPTLCTGWTARDLAAHVVVRDRRPDAAAGILLKPFAAWTDRVRNEYRDRHSYAEIIDMIRHPPALSPMRIPILDEATNVIEFFVHREDVRRAQPGWEPRDVDEGLSRFLWARLPWLAKLRLRRVPGAITVTAPGFGSFTTGAGGPTAELTGQPAELLLYFFGRQRAARVTETGPNELVDQLRHLEG